MPRPSLPIRLPMRVIAPVLLAATAALIVGIATRAGSSRGASSSRKATGSTTVQRRDLVATDTESGTLSYARPQTVFNRLTGTITWLPQVGQVIKRGGTLFKVSGAPVVLLGGNLPAYRDLSEGVSDGADVKELKENLIALGYDPSHQITVNDTFDAATTTAVEAWQAALGETQTGTVTLGQVVFLPGTQRITALNATLGSTGGSGSGSNGSNGSTGASYAVPAPSAQFVSLTTSTTATTTSTTSSTTTTPNCPTTPAQTDTTQKPPAGCPKPNGKGNNATSLAALLALLKAETAELKAQNSGRSGSGSNGTGTGGGTGGSGRAGASGGGGTSGGGTGGGSGTGGSGAGGGGSGGSGGSGSGRGSGSGTGSASATSILSSSSTQVVVTVDLDATKQTEATVGEPVTVELPDGTTVNGKISEVSPVAQSSSSSGSGNSGSGSGNSGSGSGGSGSNSSPSATIPVTISLTGHRHISGLDQAAVSVNFEQQKATNVLSVPVTALIATAGGGYAVQESAAPNRLIPVTPGLFAAGYVQISGPQVYSGLQVTDSQG
ncbi:MAG: peptidoglycan-binding protein [Solirubrobacteraceae bacterium]